MVCVPRQYAAGRSDGEVFWCWIPRWLCGEPG